MDYSNFSNSDVVKEGRKKVYASKEKLKLILPDGKEDGILDKGDLIYIADRVKYNGADCFKFRVIKFADTDKEPTVYCCEQKYFEPYFENKSNADGVEGAEKKDKVQNQEEKFNYKVPAITAVGFGFIGYMAGKKYNKNVIAFTCVGALIGGLIGVFVLKTKK